MRALQQFQQVYSQDQLNAVVRSYEDEVVKLLAVKAKQALIIDDLRKQLLTLTNENDKLKKENGERTEQP